MSQMNKILALAVMAMTAGLVSCGNNSGGGGSTAPAAAPVTVNSAACTQQAGYINGYPTPGYPNAGYPTAGYPAPGYPGYGGGYPGAGGYPGYPYGNTGVANPWTSCVAGQIPVCNGGALTCVAQTSLTTGLPGYQPAVYGYPGGYAGGGIQGGSYGYLGFGFGYANQGSFATLAACNPMMPYSCGAYGRCVPTSGLGFGGMCVQ